MTDHANDSHPTGTFTVKRGLAEMLRGGVIMDVVDAGQAKVAEDAGAVAVMALERVPADIRRDGGVARMSDPALIEGIKAAVTVPVMAKARIGHFAEAQVLAALGVDYIDESEVLTPADEAHHIDKWAYTVPFVCGATNLGEALRRISEGAALIRSKGEAGTGNVVEAVRHLRSILGDIRRVTEADSAELYGWAKDLAAPIGLVQEIAETGRLPVPLFCAGGIATPADASLVMQLGAEAVFVGSGIFKSGNPSAMARAIVEAADAPNGGLNIDAWHLVRAGVRLEELAAVPGDRILGIQLDDGPAAAEENLLEATLHHRRLPGEGEFDLVGLLRTLAATGTTAPLGVEVFSDALHELGPLEAARRAADTTRTILEEST